MPHQLITDFTYMYGTTYRPKYFITQTGRFKVVEPYVYLLTFIQQTTLFKTLKLIPRMSAQSQLRWSRVRVNQTVVLAPPEAH